MEEKIVKEIPVDKIIPNPYQPRKVFSSSALEELSKSIKEYGVLQPITVRQNQNGYELVAGERRLRAAKMADLDTIPAIINNMSNEHSAVLALFENGLTERHARALLKLPNEELMMDIVQKVVKLELTVKKTEKLINDTIESLKAEEEPEKKQNIKCSMSMKLYVNTLKQAYDAIINTGVDAKYNEIDKGDYLEVVVKIPKR